MARRIGRSATARGMVVVAGAAGVLGVMALSAGGCYTRVVNARGPGADQYNVSEPYQQDSRLDRWFYGDRENRRNRTLLGDR